MQTGRLTFQKVWPSHYLTTSPLFKIVSAYAKKKSRRHLNLRMGLKALAALHNRLPISPQHLRFSERGTAPLVLGAVSRILAAAAMNTNSIFAVNF